MNTWSFDELDAAIAMAIGDCANDEAERLLNTEVTVEPRAEFTKKLERYLRREQRRHLHRPIYKGIKAALVACMIVIVILFTACMGITTVREAIINAFAEWYDDYVLIHFEPETEQPTEEPAPTPTDPSTQAPEPEPITPPTSIEEVNAPTKVPYGLSAMSFTSKINFYQEYYNDNGERIFNFTQSLKQTDSKLDNSETLISQIEINGYTAFLTMNNEGMLSVAWEDEYYAYLINGQFLTQEEIIEIAKSVPKIVK